MTEKKNKTHIIGFTVIRSFSIQKMSDKKTFIIPPMVGAGCAFPEFSGQAWHF
jgi:hypothetical protein